MFVRFARVAQEAASAYGQFPHSATNGGLLCPSLDGDITLYGLQLFAFELQLRRSHHGDDSDFDWQIDFHVVHDQNLSDF